MVIIFVVIPYTPLYLAFNRVIVNKEGYGRRVIECIYNGDISHPIIGKQAGDSRIGGCWLMPQPPFIEQTVSYVIKVTKDRDICLADVPV
jgi:hypothetical protein